MDYANKRSLEEERIIVGGFVEYFRDQVAFGIPCEGDGDLSAVWMIAARSPDTCLALLSSGLGLLFSPDAYLPTVNDLEMAKRWGMAKF